MTAICVDASFIIRLVTQPSGTSTYLSLWEQWLANDAEIIAPSLLYYEVSNGLYKYVVANMTTLEESTQFLQAALTLPITLYHDASLYQKGHSLADELNLPATYDAHYLALSEHLNAEFWTRDRRLYNTVRSRLHWVHLAN
ncbi:MAG: type II toxin-antitoxin system VapC family toxin [Leptolyngbyaceae cyanobacterium CAN_BIN12]|nr:type II toxin-antitoxin system VapC family toxin [Leptolyngbyaceae cyanobacterium CAN_BIN12]